MQFSNQSKYQTRVNASSEKVWAALTKPELVKQYFFGTDLITNWSPGSKLIFKGEWQGQPYEDKGTVLEYEHNKSLTYNYLSNWSGKEDSPENYLIIRYDVETINENECVLTITQSNYDAEKAAHSEANWQALVDGLKKIVE